MLRMLLPEICISDGVNNGDVHDDDVRVMRDGGMPQLVFGNSAVCSDILCSIAALLTDGKHLQSRLRPLHQSYFHHSQ